MMVKTLMALTAALIGGLAAHVAAQTKASDLPPLVRRATPQAVVDEHLDAINKCDWRRLMAQYPPNVEFFLPGGQVVRGREAVGDLFRNFVKPVKEGGLCGLKFAAEHTFTVGNTVNVQWHATADFLLEPYAGADAYVTGGGLMVAQVTTFRADEIKMKK
jgi:ketosteroid isomerase-like protein